MTNKNLNDEIKSIITEEGLDLFKMHSSGVSVFYDCQLCSDQFTNKHKATMHYVLNHQFEICTICNIVFMSQFHRLTHENNFHYPLKCTYCSEVYYDYDNFKYHYEEMHSAKVCDFCAILIHPIELYGDHLQRRHTKLDTEDGLIVSNTDGECPPETIFKLHIENDSFHCLMCLKVRKLETLIGHFVFYHNISVNILLKYITKFSNVIKVISATSKAIDENSGEDDGDYVNLMVERMVKIEDSCNICFNVYSDDVPKQLHQVFCKGFVVCTECNDLFTDDKTLSDHASKTHNEILCKYGCEIKLNLENIQTHTQLIHDITACILCGIIISSQSDKLNSHLQEKHNVNLSIYKKCDKKLKFYRLGVEEESKKVLCNFCDIDLTQAMADLCNVISHYESVHGVNKKILIKNLCKNPILQACKKTKDTSFIVSKFFKIIKSNHKLSTMNTAKILEEFDSNFVDCVVSDTSHDEKSDDDESSKAYKVCEFCSCKIPSQRSLYAHLKTTHGFNLKNTELRCNLCKTEFSTKHCLRRHNKRKHLWLSKIGGEGFHQCPFCNVESKSKNWMRKHVAEHSEIYTKLCNVESFSYKCRYCEKFFWTTEQKNKHQLQEHSLEEFMTCYLCGIMSSTKVSCIHIFNLNSAIYYELFYVAS